MTWRFSSRDVLAGAGAGCLATGPMTAVMLVLHRRLPLTQRSALPPRVVTDRLLTRLGLRRPRPGAPRMALALAGHFAYGVAAGALFGPVAAVSPAPAPASGMVFGLALWAVSYLGWLPAARLFPPATDQPAARNRLMIAAHAVWGLALGVLTRRLVPAPTRPAGTPDTSR